MQNNESFLLFYINLINYPRIVIESPQKTRSETTSIIVVINGFATTVGSSLSFFARSGRNAPTSFAIQIVVNNESETTSESIMP